MSKKIAVMFPAREEILVDLTLHDISAGLIEKFVTQVVKPYYAGNLTEALRDLMQKTVADQEFVKNHETL